MSDSDQFENYEILRREDGSIFELGRGAMGVTYKARDRDLHCDVALKVINPSIIDQADTRERFLREARAAAQLRHPNIASVFRLGKSPDGTHFYAMEYCEGLTLEQAVGKQGSFPTVDALQITLQVCKALMIAEQNRLVHRDIKPANLILTKSQDDGTVVKVIDFGLAKSFSDGLQTLATMGSGGFAGTAHFASPEQLEEGDLDIRSDIYSLGVCLWFMLVGRPPFQGSMARVMSQTLSAQPPWEILKGQPLEVVTLLRRMLAKNASERPAGASELRGQLEDCLRVADLPETAQSRSLPSTTPMIGRDEFEARYPMSDCVSHDALGRIFRATDATRNNLQVTVRVIDPSLTVVPAVRRELEMQLAAAKNHPHPHLLTPLDYTITGDGILIATDWTNGFTLLDLLRQRGTLAPSEVLTILDALASAADHAIEHGLRGLNFSKEQIVIHFPQSPASSCEALISLPVIEWPDHVVKVTTLSLGDDGASDMGMIASMATIAPASGVCGADFAAVPSIAQAACELLGGRGGAAFAPLSRLSEAGNSVVRSAFSTPGDFPSARAFVEALRATVGNLSSASLPKVRKATSTEERPPKSSSSMKKALIATCLFLAIAGSVAGYYFGISQPRERDRKQREEFSEAKVKTDFSGKAQLVAKSESVVEPPKSQDESQSQETEEAQKSNIDPRMAEAFKNLDTMLIEGMLAKASNSIEGLKQMKMNADEERKFDKLRLHFSELAAEAHSSLQGSVSPVDAEIRIDGIVVGNDFPLTLKGLGEHTLRFSHEGYEPTELRRSVSTSSGVEDLGIVRLSGSKSSVQGGIANTELKESTNKTQTQDEEKEAFGSKLDLSLQNVDRLKSAWLFADSSFRQLLRDELIFLSAEDLWKARNEIYARNGLIFSTARGKMFAASFGNTYQGRDDDQERVTKRMNPIEIYNINLIKSIENKH